MTNPVLDAIPAERLGGHWLSSPDRAAIRDGRYAALAAVTADVVRSAGGAVLVAPFTAELAGGKAYEMFKRAAAPGQLVMVHIVGDRDLIAARRARRGETRDAHRPADDLTPPRVPRIDVDAALTTSQQVRRVLIALGFSGTSSVTDAAIARRFDALLCDLDGTLVDSTASVNRSWEKLGNMYGFTVEEIAAYHGRPAADTAAMLVPADAARAAQEIQRLELEDAGTVRAAVGATELLNSLVPGTWAIVTSGTRQLATARLAAAKITSPLVVVASDDVTEPKPSPEPYLLAARMLDADPARCLVLEDAAAGVQSGRAARCTVLAISGTVSTEELADADILVDGLDRVELRWSEGGYEVRLRDR
jgi:sugar-phosphatase